MKKRMVSLLLVLALCLSLCATAAAAEPALTGTLGDNGELSWVLEDGTLSIQPSQAGQTWTGQVMAACYSGGRFSQVRILTPDQPTTQVGDRVGLVKLFWVGETTFAPQCQAQRAVVAPDRTFVDGIDNYGLVTSRGSDYFVADFHAPTCIYGLNGVDQEMEYYFQPTAFADAIAKRGAVSEFFVNEQQQIYRINCYDYTVTKLTGDPATRTEEGVLQLQLPGITDGWVDAELVTGYEGLAAGDVVLYYVTALSDGGARYTLEKPSGKVTGSVPVYNVSGKLMIHNTWYEATELTVEGCTLPVSTEGFGNWAYEGGSFTNTYDFYLDRSGSICWIDQWEDGSHAPCIVLSAAWDGDALQAEILTVSGAVKTIPVRRLDGKAVSDGSDGVSPADGLAQLTANTQKAFYTYHTLASGGYGLVLASKNAPVDTGFTWGESYAIPAGSAIQSNADFTSGAIPCKADGQTRFLLAIGDGANKEYRSFIGTQFLPNTQAKGFAIAEADSVAEYVYLETPHFAVEAPKGLICITSNGWRIDPDLYEDEVYHVNIIDVDGTTCEMRVDRNLREAVGRDRPELNATPDTIFKFWAIKEINERGVVTALGDENGSPAELRDIAAMGGKAITLDGGKTYTYDDATHFIYVDLYWKDGDQFDNHLGEREPDKDIWAVNGSGTFDPEHFFNPDEVDATGDSDSAYISVEAAVIERADDPNCADYVYVLRKFW